MTEFRRYMPAEWLEDGVVVLVEMIEELPTVVRRAPWKAFAVGVIGLASVTAPSQTRVDTTPRTDVLIQYDVFGDLAHTDESDLVPSSYWSTTVARYLEGLPRFVETVEDDLPDPIV